MKNKEVAALLELTSGGTTDIDELLKGEESEARPAFGRTMTSCDRRLRAQWFTSPVLSS